MSYGSLHQGGDTYEPAMGAAERLRDAGLNVILHAGGSSLKSQMKRADASGARYAVIVGEQEAAGSTAGVKALRAADAAAELLPSRKQLRWIFWRRHWPG